VDRSEAAGTYVRNETRDDGRSVSGCGSADVVADGCDASHFLSADVMRVCDVSTLSYSFIQKLSDATHTIHKHKKKRK